MQDWEKHEISKKENARLAHAPWYVRLRWWWLIATFIFLGAPVRYFLIRHEAGLMSSPGGALLLPSETAAMNYMLLGTVALIAFAALTAFAFLHSRKDT